MPSRPWIASGPALVAIACLALAAVSLAVQHAADYDPSGWIVWGREVLHLDLDTAFGPSWKPGAVLFTAVYAMFGGAAPALWMITARFGALLAIVMAYRLAARQAGRFGGAVAAVTLLVTSGFLRSATYGQSDPMWTGLLLFACERALAGAQTPAVLLLLLASLLRPETWPLLGAYSIYLWWRSPRRRWLLPASWAIVALLWFGGDWWGSGNPFESGTKAKQYVLRERPVVIHPGLFMLKSSITLVPWPVLVLAAVGLLFAVLRRQRAVLLLAATALVTTFVVVAMAQDGYPTLARFLFGGVALTCVLAGVGAGQLARSTWLRFSGPIAAAVIVAALLPFVVDGVDAWVPQIRAARTYATGQNSLPAVIAAAGGAARILSCKGYIITHHNLRPALAWDLDTDMSRIVAVRRHGVVIMKASDQLAHLIGRRIRPVSYVVLGRADGWEALYVSVGRPVSNPCRPAAQLAR